MSLFCNNSGYVKVFRTACSTGDTSTLADLISKKKFQVNKSLSVSKAYDLPILQATKTKSVPVLTLLLDQGATPNPKLPNSVPAPLTAAVKTDSLEIVKLLVDRGADITAVNFQAVRRSMEQCTLHDKKTENSKEILGVLVNLVAKLTDVPAHDENSRNIVSYCKFIDAIIRNDMGQVVEQLKDYSRFVRALQKWWTRPILVAFLFNRSEVLKTFVRAGVDVERIFFKAAEGNFEVAEFCLQQPKFDPHLKTPHYRNVLHIACIYNHVELIKLLVKSYGFTFDVLKDGKTSPLFWIHDFYDILGTFPEIDLTKQLPLFRERICEHYKIFLEHGANPRVGTGAPFIIHFPASAFNQTPQNHHEDLCSNCPIVRYLQKLMLITDLDDLELVIKKVLYIDLEEFMEFENAHKEDYEMELIKMKSVKISQSTTTRPGKNLLDFIHLSPNDVVRYSNNVNLRQIYEDNKQDFRNQFPHYGFAINLQLRRGQVRCQRLDSAFEILCTALGTGLPYDFAELIFGTFSNSAMEYFKIRKPKNQLSKSFCRFI